MNSMAEDKILVEAKDGIGWITFNNPAKRNAVSLAMTEAVEEALRNFEKDASVKVVILKGAGDKAFVAGADISKFEDERASEEAVRHYNETGKRVTSYLARFPKPTIAMIRGFCVGGGVSWATCCDLRIASDTGRFAVPAAKLGLGYAHDGIRRAMDLVGPAKVKEIFFTARQFSAEEAAGMGLINQVVQDALLKDYVTDYAKRIAENAPLTIYAVKETIYELLRDEAERDYTRCETLVKTCFDSKDYIEGRTAFMEKRKPKFQGS